MYSTGNMFESFDSMFNVMFIIPIIMFVLVFGIIIFTIIKSINKNKKTMKRIESNYASTVDKYYNILINDPILSKNRGACKVFGTIGTIMIVVGFVGFFFLRFFSFVLIIVGALLSNFKRRDYNKHYKENVMSSALKEFDENLTYYPNDSIPESQYREARFERYDRYRSEDRIEGKISGYDFVMADVHVEDRHTDKDGHTSYTTLFFGPVAIINLPERINLNISVINNQIKLFNGGTRVEIDNSEFEEYFDVYSDNQVTAMRILTPAVTTKMMDLYQKYDFRFEFKIIDNIMYFRFHTGGLFNPNPSNTREEAIGVALYFEILNGIKEIMEEVVKATKTIRK